MSFISKFRQQIRTYIYNPVYKGPFEYKKKDTMMSKFPFGVNLTVLEEEMEEIKQIQEKQISDADVSPFHLVWRYKGFYGNMWYLEFILKFLSFSIYLNILIGLKKLF